MMVFQTVNILMMMKLLVFTAGDDDFIYILTHFIDDDVDH